VGTVKPRPALPPSPLSRALIALLPLALLAAAWGAYASGWYVVSQLDLSQFKTCNNDFPGGAMDRCVARHFLPFIAAAVLLDGLALAALVLTVAGGRLPVVLRVLLAAALGPVGLASVGWHGLHLLVELLFFPVRL
jgi:hypothetical protein